MGALLAGVALVAIPLTLLGSALAHVLRPGGLPAALRAHRTVPSALVVPVAGLAVAAEAASGLLAAVRPWPGLPLAGGLLGCYAVYGGYLLAARPPVPCGCAGSGDRPLTGWTVVRATALAGLAGLGSLGDAPSGGRLAVAAVAGTVFAVLLWALPAALHDPTMAPEVS